MVSFLGPFSLSMCNVGMYCSLSTFLLFLIMTYDETTFWQDERRRRKIEQKIDSRNRKREKATERKEERVKTIHDKDTRRSFTEKGDAWKRLKEKMTERWRRWRGYFVIATNVSAVHCALQLQPAYTCLFWTLYYPSMPWSFRDRIIFLAVNGNY